MDRSLLRNWAGIGLVLVLLSLACQEKVPTQTGKSSTPNIIFFSEMKVSPQRVLAGGAQSVVSARLINQSDAAATGVEVGFSATGGAITALDTTDDEGWARAQFHSGARAGQFTITASYGTNARKSISIQVDSTRSSLSSSFQVVTSVERLLANGVRRARIRAQALTGEGKPIVGETIDFRATIGQVAPSALPDSSGWAAVDYVAPALEGDGTTHIIATYGGLSDTVAIRLTGITFDLQVQPQALIADGRSTADVWAVLKETTSTIAISGEPVTFGTNLGTIPNEAETDASGVARVEFLSASGTGTAAVVAHYGPTFSDTVYIVLGESVPAHLNLTAEPATITADNRSTSQIKATISDDTNNPVPDGTVVQFEIVQGTGTIESLKLTEGGSATNILIASARPDTVLIAAHVGGLSDTTTVYYVVGPPARVLLSAEVTELPADGITTTQIMATLLDGVGNPVRDGTLCVFSADIGDITGNDQTVKGVAVAQFSSSVTGTATIRAQGGDVSGTLTLNLLPGPPNSIVLTYDPTSAGVRDAGRNQTVTVTADVRDAKGNPVADGTSVVFSIFSGPRGGEFLSSTEPIPSLGGRAQVALNSGVKSGTVRIQATVVDSASVPIEPRVQAISTEIIIHAGPPFMEDINERLTSHLSVGASPTNIRGWDWVNNTAEVVVVVGDIYNNPVPPGTAVYFTTTGGVISTHTGYTNDEGVATVTIHSGHPRPDIFRYRHTFYDPNMDRPDFNRPDGVIPGMIPDYEFSEVVNSLGGMGENDGIARILAVSEGVDSLDNSVRVWGVANVIFSGAISVFTVTTDSTDLLPGETAHITIRLYDNNGNPIVPGSTLTADAAGGKLSWSALTTDDPGTTLYRLNLTNNLDPSDPNARDIYTPVTIQVRSDNGNASASSAEIHLRLF